MGKIKVGSRVKLTRPRANYYISSNNPAVGTEYECAGKVTGWYRNSATPIIVKWENGSINNYHKGTLSLFDEDIISIWE